MIDKIKLNKSWLSKIAITVIILLVVPLGLYSEVNNQNSVVGQWADFPNPLDNQSGRMVYIITEDSNNKLSGKMLIGSDSEPLTEVSFDHGKLHFRMGFKPAESFIFNGIIKSDGLEIDGHILEGDQNADAYLHRLSPDPYRVMPLKDLQDKVEKNDGKAMVELGYRYYYGDGAVFDLTKAEKLFRQAVDLEIVPFVVEKKVVAPLPRL